ncbi:MAG: hypothetical protein ACYSUY_14595 [Planctomycetota bacterium]|jgi:hypothetical protein
MDKGTFLLLVYGGVEIVLLIWAVYLNERLKRYIDKQYPEEGKVIRSYEWQWYPWSVGQKTLRALIKKQSANDPELANQAKKAKRAIICVFAWPIVVGLILFCIALF